MHQKLLRRSGAPPQARLKSGLEKNRCVEVLAFKGFFRQAIHCCRAMPVAGGSLEFIDGTPDRVLRGYWPCENSGSKQRSPPLPCCGVCPAPPAKLTSAP